MIDTRLGEFISRVVSAGRIEANDVRMLSSLVLEDGLDTKEEVEALLLLDRAAPAAAGWSDLLSALLVDFVVWGSRPSGVVTQDAALWLTTILDLSVPGETALRIAEAVAAEADEVDAVLVSFILAGRHRVGTLAA